MIFSDADVPEGFVKIVDGRYTYIVQKENAKIIVDALSGKGLFDRSAAKGRHALRRFPLGPNRFGLVKLCRRGGLVRFLLSRHFLFFNRPLQEFHAHYTACQVGLPVPFLLGVCWSHRFLLFSGAIATEEIPGSDLAYYLQQNSRSSDQKQQNLASCGKIIRAMHDAGIMHHDLNIKNLFIAPAGPMLLDFDKAVIRKPLSSLQRAFGLLRLRRSFDKHRRPRAEFETLAAGYGAFSVPWWLHGLGALRNVWWALIRKRKTE